MEKSILLYSTLYVLLNRSPSIHPSIHTRYLTKLKKAEFSSPRRGGKFDVLRTEGRRSARGR